MLEYRVLGPLEVAAGDGPLPLTGRNQRAVLAFLLLHANQLVSTERIVDELWGEGAPRTAVTSVHNAVSQLRKLLGPGVLHTRGAGYVLEAGEEQVDALRFEALVRGTRGLPPAERAAGLRSALELWRGPALVDCELESFAQPEIRRLEDLRLAALEERFDADLELGHHADLVPELEALVRRHPTRERVRGQLMLALYRCGRQADALAAYHAGRRALVEELGIEPSPELQALYSSILRQERALAPASPVLLDDHYGEVLAAAHAGRLVVVLGPGVAPGVGGARLADALASRFSCPPEHTGLAAVAQYVCARHGAGPLGDAIAEAIGEGAQPRPLHRWVASLAPLQREARVPHLLVVTTTLDGAIERAYEEAGEEIDVVSYLGGGRDRGRFLHAAPGVAPTVVAEPNAYPAPALAERPALLRLYGNGAQPETAAVREDDHIDYLAGPDAGGLPVTLAARLRRSHLLFLGYAVDDWTLRVFLRRVFGAGRFAYRSWAVAESASAYARDLWGERGVDVFDSPLEAYGEELVRRTGELAELEVRS